MNRKKQFPIATQLREKAHMYALAVDDVVRRLATTEECGTESIIQDAVDLAIAELFAWGRPAITG